MINNFMAGHMFSVGLNFSPKTRLGMLINVMLIKKHVEIIKIKNYL